MKILVIGGYGNFGKRLVTRLLRNPDYQVVIGGRSHRHALHQPPDFQQLDILTTDLVSVFRQLNPDIVVNACGPYQDQQGTSDYRVARACIDSGCHYIDLADARAFVAGFASQLDAAARAASVMLVSGASTVPGLTAAVIDHYRQQFQEIHSVDYAISPGNRCERGLATVSSILSYTGRAFTTLIDGAFRTVYGWQDIERRDFGAPLGKRWLGNCDIPDLELLPLRYPELQTVRFRAGLEVSLLHVGLWLLSGLSRYGIVTNWKRYARPITHISNWFIRWGSDSGGMDVYLRGIDRQHVPKTIRWQLVAEHGVGPNVPIIAAELVIQRIAAGRVQAGAMPCMGLFTLNQFVDLAAYWQIYHRENVS